MYTRKYLCILIILLSQELVRVESLSLSADVVDKMRSIVQWLDTISDATVFDYIQRVNRGAGLNLFEGDIKDYDPGRPQLRTAITNHQQLWNTRVVPYTIDSVYDSATRKELMAAMDEFHRRTCIRWVPRTTQTDYVVFKQISGCYSNIGRTGGEQDISLTDGCLKKGTAIHEMMHALGFWHEQSRPDRDSWVHIISSNIQDGKEYNFEKLKTSEADTLGETYDYGSVMHYSKYAFSRNGNPTIMPTRQTDVPLGQRDGLSDKDVHKIQRLYRCDSPAATTPAPVVTSKMTTKTPITTKKPVVTPKATNPTQPAGTTHLPQTQPAQTHVPTHAQTHSITQGVQTTQKQQPTMSTTTTSKTTTTPQAPPLSMLHTGWSLWSGWSKCDLKCSHFRYRMCLNYDSVYCPGNFEEVEPCAFPCKPATTLGCWTSSAGNLSIPTVEGLSPELTGNYTARSDPVSKCQNYASLNGFAAFALLDNGQCLTGPGAFNDFPLQGPASNCGLTGSATAMSVYTFETDIDGEWSLWTNWGHCTRSCGLGRQYRYRRCDNPPPVGSGAACPGHDQEAVICNVGQCIVPYKCGNRYHTGSPGTSGLIWVQDYENFMECEYEISTGDFRSTISLYISEINIENSRGCVYDSLMIFDGMDTRSPLVGAFCGSMPPKSFESTTNNVYIKFQSDETNKGRGYTIFYSINSRSSKACVKPPPAAHATVFVEGNMVGNRAWYSCDTGFKMVGKSPITCLDQPGFALWDDVFPRCVTYRKRSVGHGAKFNCEFENSFCGFKNDVNGNIKWAVKESDVITGVPKQNASFPRGDNSTTSDNVLYAESTVLQAPGDSARIKSQLFETAPYPHCLKFDYILDGRDMSYLNVQLISNSITNGTVLEKRQTSIEDGQVLMSESQSEHIVWRTSGDKVHGWSTAEVTISGSTKFQVVFEAVLGSEIGSSAAIDNIALVYGECQTGRGL